MTNHEIADILDEIALFLEMDEVAFKPRAYSKAASQVRKLDKELNEIYMEGGRKAIDAIPTIGRAISEKIEILLTKKKLPYLSKLRKKYPIEVKGLSLVEGLGPKTIKLLYKKGKIKTVRDLEVAIQKGVLNKVKGLGKKTQENIAQSLHFLKSSGNRKVLGFVWPNISKIVEYLREVQGVRQVEIAGSARRRRATIGDVDIVATSSKPKVIMDAFVSMPQVSQVLAHGKTKSMVRMSFGLEVDLRVVPEEAYGATLVYFTGSKDHTVKLRNLAIDKGYTLNEYGLYKKVGRGKGKRIAAKTEKAVYKALGLSFISPELREMQGEIEAAKAHKLPKLIEYDDLMGDLQVQTNWTDGSSSILEMALAAKKAGLKYIVITDHTKALAMTGGSDERRLKKQMKEIDRLNKKISGFTILKGAEVNILKDGSLDINDQTLKMLDVVGAGVHTNMKMGKRDMTNRICRAIQNPNVDILFHPTGRRINRRPPFPIDINEIISVAKQTKTVLEIDCFPDRSDLKDLHIRRAIDAGVKLSIDSDAHDPSHFDFLHLGIGQARRGWAKKKDIVNAHSVKKMLKMLK